MNSWSDVESNANENGFIPDDLYYKYVKQFPVCPSQDRTVSKAESEIWEAYLSATQKKNKNKNLYSEMYRYEWYEGRKRTGFWGNIEDAIRNAVTTLNPKITIFSAGSGRDLLKVGISAGIWKTTCPDRYRGTHKEVDIKYFRLVKPDARIIVTEYDAGNYIELTKTIDALKKNNCLSDDMISVSKWNFREKTPVAKETQDIVVFSLTGNYATINEQPLILREIARCIRPGGHFVGSTLSEKFDFNKAGNLLNKIKFVATTPLGWPIAVDFLKWQVQWGKMAGKMNKLGYWANVSAETWGDFLKPVGMKTVRIYDGPSSLVPVEVLVTVKE